MSDKNAEDEKKTVTPAAGHVMICRGIGEKEKGKYKASPLHPDVYSSYHEEGHVVAIGADVSGFELCQVVVYYTRNAAKLMLHGNHDHTFHVVPAKDIMAYIDTPESALERERRSEEQRLKAEES